MVKLQPFSKMKNFIKETVNVYFREERGLKMCCKQNRVIHHVWYHQTDTWTIIRQTKIHAPGTGPIQFISMTELRVIIVSESGYTEPLESHWLGHIGWIAE